MRLVRAMVGVAAIASAACSLLLSFDDFDRDFGTVDAADDAPGTDAGTTDGPAPPDGSLPDGNEGGSVCPPEPTCGDADIHADPSNCGACTHRCLDNTPKCTNGVCGPEFGFFWFGVSPTGVAVDDKYFYGIGRLSGALAALEGGAARGSKTAGGGGDTLAYYTQDPRRLVVRGSDLYWTQAGGIAHSPNAVAADGGVNTANLVVSGQVSPC